MDSILIKDIHSRLTNKSDEELAKDFHEAVKVMEAENAKITKQTSD